MSLRPTARLTLLTLCAVLLCAAAGYSQTRSSGAKPATVAPGEWLSLCGKCASPKVTSSSGIGTANARAEARLTRADVLSTDGPCDGDNTPACIQRETTRVYRASADCTVGKITTILDESVTLAGVWDNSDIGGGRTKWRGADGQIVGRDNASNGLAISQQWEVLCPGPVTPALIARAAAAQGVPPRGGAVGAAAAINAAQAGRAAGSALPAGRQGPATAAASRGNPPICGGERLCTEVNDFAVSMVEFRASLAAPRKLLTATLRFENKTNRPVILAYIPRSGIATDERSNRYSAVDTDVRGIGLVGRTVDAKFVLQPGQRSDARFTYIWDAGRTIYGTTFDVEITVREVVDQGNNQVTLGAEYPLRLTGLVDGARAGATSAPAGSISAAPAANAPPIGAAAPAVTRAASEDRCAGSKRPCFDSGAFTATVTGFVGSVVGNRHHTIRITVEIRNNTEQPLMLAYKNATNSAVDNLGNRYTWGRPGTYDGSVQGIGIMIPGRSVDAQFRLAPGAARIATFNVIRYESGPKPAGSIWAFDTVLAELRPLPNGTQTEVVRDHSVHLTDLSAGGAAGPATPGSVADRLRGILGGSQK